MHVYTWRMWKFVNMIYHYKHWRYTTEITTFDCNQNYMETQVAAIHFRILRLVYPMFTVSLGCPFFITALVFSNVHGLSTLPSMVWSSVLLPDNPPEQITPWRGHLLSASWEPMIFIFRFWCSHSFCWPAKPILTSAFGFGQYYFTGQ
jgi:hypothetical protein